MRATVISLVAVAGLLLLPARANAATYTVTKFTDSADGACNADCSLREAIIAANANLGQDTIILPPGTYTLSLAPSGEGPGAFDETQRDLDILEGVTITGGGVASEPLRSVRPRDRLPERLLRG